MSRHIHKTNPNLPTDRALRVYRLHQGKTVFLETEDELAQLDRDYHDTFGEYVAFDKIRHPSLTGGQMIVTLYGSVSNE